MFQEAYLQTLWALNSALVIQLAGVVLTAFVDPYIKRAYRNRVCMIVTLITLLLYEPQISAQFGYILYRNDPVFWHTLITAAGYILRPMILFLFIKIIGLQRKQKILYVLIAVNTAVNLSAFFLPWVFFFDDNSNFHRGPLGFTAFIVSFILILWLLIGAAVKYKSLKYKEGIIPVVTSLFVIIAVFLDVRMDFNPPVSFLTVAMTEGIVFFYIWLHIQFVREHEEALRAEQRIRIMISQIQPHFLFNTLTTIQALIDIDPEKASEVVEKFAMYLRQNIDALDQESLIPVENEIEHTRVYSDIEKVRFPSIDIIYDIKDVDFLIPSLTIQPMVENAIRHGVRGRKQGQVVINTYRDGNDHVVSIRDNGSGFDVEQMMNEIKKGGHIGVKNVRDRIMDMTGGTFQIESRIDEGTTITIRIPADQET